MKLNFILAFAISTLGGIVILAWGLEHQNSIWFFLCFLMAKFGVTCTFIFVYVANAQFFPTLFAATSIGICNFTARLAVSSSYLVSQIEEPVPMYLFTSLCAFSAICSYFI